MKKLFLIALALLLIFFAGCGENKVVNYEATVNKSFAKLNTEPNGFLVYINQGPIINGANRSKTEFLDVDSTGATLTLFNSMGSKKERIVGSNILKSQEVKQINYSRQEFFQNLKEMITSLTDQTKDSIKKDLQLFKKSNYIVPVYCLNNKKNTNSQFNQSGVKIESTDLNYFNPFTETKQTLKDVTLIKFCYRQDNGLPQILSFDSSNAVKFLSNPSNPSVKNPDSFSITFNYQGQG